MSVFGGNQVGEIIVGSTYGASTDAVDFIENAAEKDIQVFSGDGSAVTAGPFKFLQKAASAAAGIEYTEVIDPKHINFIKAVKYTAPENRELRVSGFTGDIRANATYEVYIRMYNDGGTLSSENFRMIPAFYVTPSDVTGLTFTDILNELKTSLDKALARESNDLFTINANTINGSLDIEGGNGEFVLGRKDGRAVEFDLQATVVSNGDQTTLSGVYYNDLSVETINPGVKGSGAGFEVANLEWFLKGFKYSRYRDIASPANFTTPYNVNPGSTYHIVTIGYFNPREYTNVERQHRYLYLAVENADQDGAGAGTELTAINALIDDIEVATGLVIPAIV